MMGRVVEVGEVEAGEVQHTKSMGVECFVCKFVVNVASARPTHLILVSCYHLPPCSCSAPSVDIYCFDQCCKI